MNLFIDYFADSEISKDENIAKGKAALAALIPDDFFIDFSRFEFGSKDWVMVNQKIIEQCCIEKATAILTRLYQMQGESEAWKYAVIGNFTLNELAIYIYWTLYEQNSFAFLEACKALFSKVEVEELRRVSLRLSINFNQTN